MTIDTNALSLRALDEKELNDLIYDLSGLEKRLGVSYKAEPITGAFKQVLIKQLETARTKDDGFIWYTFWLLIRKSDSVVVGSADFKGEPDAEGQVEIGYGLAPEFEHMGYMTCAVKAMCAWALDSGAKAVLADTLPSNLASQAVLERCGFSFLGYRDELLLFIKKPDGE